MEFVSVKENYTCIGSNFPSVKSIPTPTFSDGFVAYLYERINITSRQ